MPSRTLNNLLGIKPRGPKKKGIPYRRSIAGNLAASQRSRAQDFTPDLGATNRLASFAGHQQSVILNELTKDQQETLASRRFSFGVIPSGRTPRQVAQPLGKNVLAAAIGGATSNPTSLQARPRTILSLKGTRSFNSGMLRGLARHEVAHQLNRESGDVQHNKIILASGVGNQLPGRHSASDDRPSPAPTGKQFFKTFQRISRQTPRQEKITPRKRSPRTPRTSSLGSATSSTSRPPKKPNIRNLLGIRR